MGTAFLYGNGGCTGGTGATLTVNAPAGAVVTISKDGKSKTKTAGADGLAVFKGLDSGTWRVALLNEDGSEHHTWDVSVTVDYTTVVDFFDGYLYNAGDEREAFTGGWYCDDSSGLTKTAECMTLESAAYRLRTVSTDILFDTTGYTTITVDCECNAYDSAYFGIADADFSIVANVSMEVSRAKRTLDISGYQGEYLLYFSCAENRTVTGNTAQARVYSVKIE